MGRLHYVDPHPNGDPVVLLLHGLGATGASWGMQFAALSESGYRPVAPDLPGFGDSPYDQRGWTPARIAMDLVALLDELECGSAHVVGLSMGGVIAQQFACNHAQKTKKLVLVSTFSRMQPDSISGWIYFLKRGVVVSLLGLRAQARVVAQRVFPDPDKERLRNLLVETISHADVHAYRGAMRALAKFDSSKWLGNIKNPTLVITGSADTTISPERQKLLAAGVSGARHEVIEGAGHAVPIDQAELFNRLLVEFLCEP